MCGIAAVQVRRGEGAGWLSHILGRIEHRGVAPTLYESALDCPGGWCLGANRLPIVTHPNGRQPVLSADRRFLVVFNGEVFNYREIGSILSGIRLSPGDRDSDTHVLAGALAEWGLPQALNRIVWEGAFLALECMTGRVWAVRDHLGIKPLYRAHFRYGIAFASEIKALVDLPDCAQIYPIQPGGAELFDDEGVRLKRLVWWELAGRAVKPVSAEDAKRELLAALRDAVHLRVPRQGPYAIALSGGLDSSAVLRLAIETGRKPQAYVLHRPNSADLRFARSLCRKLRVPLTEVAGLDADRLRAELRTVVWTVETWEWQVVNHSAPMLALTAAIHADDHRVVLSGEGADELFLGYARSDQSAPPKSEQIERIAALHRTNCRRLDRMGMRDQLEFRVPFLDRSVTELALSMPSDLLVRNGVSKWILREAFRGILPTEIIDRPKMTMARGAGYEYSADTTPTVFGDLPDSEQDGHSLIGSLARYPAEKVFLEQFTRCGYRKAGYILSRSL